MALTPPRCAGLPAAAGWLLAAAVAAGAAPAPAPAPSPAPARPAAAPMPPTPVPLHRAVSELGGEASDAWFAGKPFPRTQSNFAQEKNWTVPADALLRALGTRLNDKPALDAYIKWQLLSFRPDFSKATPAVLRQLVSGMPAILAQPSVAVPPSDSQPGAAGGRGAGGGGLSIEARQTTVLNPGALNRGGVARPELGVINTGVGVQASGTASHDQRYVTLTVEAAQSELLRLRQIAVNANAPVLAYRDALLAALPADQGQRAIAMLADLRQRVAAAEPSYAQAATRFVDECRRGGPGLNLSAAQRQSLVAGLRELAMLRGYAMKQVHKNDKGQVVVTREEAAIPLDLVAAAAQGLGVLKEMTGGPR